MFLFLARHAEGEAVKDRWQTPNSKLSDIGKKQAEALGKQVKFYKIDKIFSSDWERSRKTAEIISKEAQIDFEILDYIHERKQLPDMYGALRNSEISMKYANEYRKNFGNLDWKFEGKEESTREVLDRTSKLLLFLTKNYQGKRVLVVSHDLFIRCLLSNVLLGRNYSHESMFRAINNLAINNTGLSLLIHSSQWQTWQINYINNYSHLKYLEKKSNQ
ncbi:MAG TPA: histidine phosphatase family protein [Patescibacteria group bacterium]